RSGESPTCYAGRWAICSLAPIQYALDCKSRALPCPLTANALDIIIGPMTAKRCKVAIDSNRCGGSASASRQLGYLSPEASFSAVLGVQAASECLVRLESNKVLDA